MKTPRHYLLVYAIAALVSACAKENHPVTASADLLKDMEHSMKAEILDVWYPKAMDQEYGGFLSSFTYDFMPTPSQDKMVVTQSRHVWTSSKAWLLYPEVQTYKTCASHGFRFLKDKMWDNVYGGFYTLTDRQGNVKTPEKTAYGNAFGIYGLAAYYAASRDTAALNLARKAFRWLEKHSYDSVNNGYYQHLRRDGGVIVREHTIGSTAETGYKDQNSSIHLLEAFTELYQVWPDALLRERLKEMLFLIRDSIVQPQGYMVLFFQPDWTPVSFRDSSHAVIEKHHHLDHVSFGHDVEIAYLMLEASHVLGLKADTVTLTVAKRLVDHALDNGWDEPLGGFYDGGYYFKDSAALTITHPTKNWWAQAEGLNTLSLMATLFPSDRHRYYDKFEQLWAYVDMYLIDHEYGEWYQGGLDKQPELKTALKGHIWKASYHQFRGLANCVARIKASRVDR
ncbi:MAG TPA: AGE family epimerase/isomerase [Ohtaekwangia sp.]|nr:AGE family epimerase/isomerase [Ohtaekwangia sp.]